MIELIKYQLIVTICIIVFYGFYKIFLKNETFFNFNRFLILFLISISFAIPFVKIGTSLPIVPQKPNIITIGQSSEIVTQPIAETKTNIPVKTANHPTPINWNLITLYAIEIINLAGILWGLIRLIKSLFFFRYLRRKSEIATFNSTKFYIVPETIGSFSFFNSIFISKETIKKGEVGSILAHELTHINEHHSIDSIFLAIVKSFLWFNPIFYLFEKELKTIHEYIADSSVIKKEQDKNNYIDILLNQTIGPKMFDLTNNFNSTTIFRRIKMITKAKSTKRTLWKYLILILPISISLVAFSCTEKKTEPKEQGWIKIVKKNVGPNGYDLTRYFETKHHIDIWCENPGGEKVPALRKHSTNSMVYPYDNMLKAIHFANKQIAMGKLKGKEIMPKTKIHIKWEASTSDTNTADSELIAW
jgi:beta-lactamase regulating signal transducer with metallopeptidase domain